jgi:hypothetical protein
MIIHLAVRRSSTDAQPLAERKTLGLVIQGFLKLKTMMKDLAARFSRIPIKYVTTTSIPLSPVAPLGRGDFF